MKSFVILFFSVSTIIVGGFSKSFPDEFKCAYGDGMCIQGKINEILKKFPTGNADMGLISTDPIDMPKFNITPPNESPVNIKLNINKSTLTGFNNANVFAIKGFGKDIKGVHEMHMKMPAVILAGNYEVDGRILLLPITGNGDCNITFVNIIIKFKFEGKPVERDGRTYLEIAKSKVDENPEKIQVYLQNLFNGDKALGDNMNKFLNENWKDIHTELKAPIEGVLNKVYSNIIGKVFEAFPYEELFTKEK